MKKLSFVVLAASLATTNAFAKWEKNLTSTGFEGEYRSVVVESSGLYTAALRVKSDKNGCALVRTQGEKDKNLNGRINLHFASVESVLLNCDQNVTGNILPGSVAANANQTFDSDFPFGGDIHNPDPVNSLQFVQTSLRQQIGWQRNADGSIKEDRKGNQKTVNKSYSRPTLYGYLDGVGLVKGKKAVPALPSNFKGNGNYLFSVHVTDVSEDGKVAVGHIRARQDIEFSNGQVIAKKTEFPVFFSIYPESIETCNGACRKGEETHASVSRLEYLSNGRGRANIKATNELGETMDWYEITDGLAKVFGVTRDAVNNRYIAFGTDINGNAALMTLTEI